MTVGADTLSATASQPLILQVSSTLHIGGAEHVLAQLAHGLDRRQFGVAACYLKENGTVGQRLEAEGIELLSLPGHVDGSRDRLTSLKLRRLIRHRGVKLIHTHDIHGLVDGALCRATLGGLRHVHSFHWGNYPRRQPRFRMIERVLWREPDALIAVGQRQAEQLRSLYGIPTERLEVIGNGVDGVVPDLAPPVRAAIGGRDAPVIVSISTMTEQKGLPHLVEAAALLKQRGVQFLLLMVGDGPLRIPLETKVQNLGLQSQVRFIGWIEQAASRALPAADIFVQSSLWEAMSVVVIESMACGKPAVVTHTGDNDRVVVNDESGLVVPPADAPALANALARLLDDAEMRQHMGAVARERHARQFTVRHMCAAHEAVYRRLLDH